MAHALYLIGLDPARFRSYSTAEGEELNITTLDSQIPESKRYNDADPLKIRCRHCTSETDFAPIHDREVRYDAIDENRVKLLTRPYIPHYRSRCYCLQDLLALAVVKFLETLVFKCSWRGRSENTYRSTTWAGLCAMTLLAGTEQG